MFYQILISLAVGILIGLLVFYLLTRRRDKIAPSQEVSSFSDKDAETLLKKQGYQILSKRQRETVITKINGKDHFGFVEADYLVRKGRKSYVVMVHFSEGDADPNEQTTRRRLLEYDNVFSAEGLLVLDVNRGEIHDVSFRFPHEKNIDFFFRLLIALFIIGGVIGIIWMLAMLRLF
ncbi:MAG: hypothetical protein HQ596_07345 [Candidatus Saganbacteria bacterium]|nr:hypothetical protein [Candidatus Saganbacteria bacterium]